jgi:hypothetical protein
MQTQRAAFGCESHVDAGFRRQLAAKYRPLRSELSRLLEDSTDPGSPIADGLEAYARRSVRVRPVARRLVEQDAGSRLTAAEEWLGQSVLQQR